MSISIPIFSLLNTYLSLINTPDVIISETSNGTRYAIATSTELNAIEKKHPVEITNQDMYNIKIHHE